MRDIEHEYVNNEVLKDGGQEIVIFLGGESNCSNDIGSSTDCGVEPDNFHASETCGPIQGTTPLNPLHILQYYPRSANWPPLRLYLLIFWYYLCY